VSADDIADGTIADPLVTFDTAVLYQLGNIGTYLADPDFKSRIESFVFNGGKLIIWDSEMWGEDYSNFVYPFVTNSAGAFGATGTMLVVENSSLGSADPASPFYVNADAIGGYTDAVGDANVMITYDGNWSVASVATNVNGVQGPVEAYAGYGNGLIIYQGLDAHYLDDPQVIDNPTALGGAEGQANLGYLWELMLSTGFNPASLPHSRSASGITLAPAEATNEVGTSHTVTASLIDMQTDPVPGVDVTFRILSGPNSPKTFVSPSDGTGRASFTYTSNGTPGTDLIQAEAVFETAVDVPTAKTAQNPTPRTSNVVKKNWVSVLGEDYGRTYGYAMMAADEGWFSYGQRGFYGTANFTAPGGPDTAPMGTALSRRIVGGGWTATGEGYLAAAADGAVFAHGDAVFAGSLFGKHLSQPIVGIAPDGTGKGYWLAGADGGVFAFGDAPFLGSLGGLKLAEPIVGIARTATGKGYYLVAADGGVFAFGDAVFAGSMSGHALGAPIVGMAVPLTGGYLLVGSDGGVFAFGGAEFNGSMGGARMAAPVVGIAATYTGNGYWLAGADGGVFAFGDAPFFGSMTSHVPGLRGPVVGICT